jgi:C4-dicarboxylate-specific signal transduction histidine kinase
VTAARGSSLENSRQYRKLREKLRQAEADLAYMSRVSTMAKLAASLAHEVKQPIAAAAMNARTCARWLQREEPKY